MRPARPATAPAGQSSPSGADPQGRPGGESGALKFAHMHAQTNRSRIHVYKLRYTHQTPTSTSPTLYINTSKHRHLSEPFPPAHEQLPPACALARPRAARPPVRCLDIQRGDPAHAVRPQPQRRPNRSFPAGAMKVVGWRWWRESFQGVTWPGRGFKGELLISDAHALTYATYPTEQEYDSNPTAGSRVSGNRND